MSREHTTAIAARAVVRAACLTMLIVVAMLAGCVSEPASDSRAASDSVRQPMANDSVMAVLPSPGFSSADGTPVSTPAPATASTVAAARLAPPPSVALAARSVTDDRASLERLPAGEGHDIVVGKCVICHSAALIEQQHKDTAGWNKSVTQMVTWGAPLTAAEKPVLVAYLSEQFGARAAGPPARPAP